LLGFIVCSRKFSPEATAPPLGIGSPASVPPRRVSCLSVTFFFRSAAGILSVFLLALCFCAAGSIPLGEIARDGFSPKEPPPRAEYQRRLALGFALRASSTSALSLSSRNSAAGQALEFFFRVFVPKQSRRVPTLFALRRRRVRFVPLLVQFVLHRR
jgi:hypothetical protein